MKTSETKLFNQEFLDQWYHHFHQLEAYSRQRAGSPCATLLDEDEELAQWVRIQRGLRIMLPAELKNKLAALNFNFEEQDHSWEQRYQQLACFARQHGHTWLPVDDARFEDLRDWLIRQIHDQKFLSPCQYEKLDQLGVDWDWAATRDHRWERMFLKLKAFRKAFGHCRVPQGWSRDKQLASWICIQRRRYAAATLRPDRQRRLEELDFVWNIRVIYDAKWEQHFQQLALFYRTHGHCRVPGSYKTLTSWIENQRTYKKKHLLPADRERRLNEIRFVWSFGAVKENDWNEKYRQLREYKKQHGHCLVPVNSKVHKPLGQWVGAQRRLEAKNQLPALKKKKLNQLGFVWSRDTHRQLKLRYDNHWNAWFEKLRDYQQAYGSCQVSQKTDPKLRQWVRWQRILYRQGRLPEARRQALEAIGFAWRLQDGYWQKMYEALTCFHTRYGHTRVPAGWLPNPRLAAWVYLTKKNRAALPAHQTALLNQIGFDWVLHKKTVVAWEDMYQRLLAFRRQQGHTRVPAKWAQDPKLAKWVSRMRYEKTKLLPQRLALLEAIGFDWGYRTAAVRTGGKPA